jgi:hypothetical protein
MALISPPMVVPMLMRVLAWISPLALMTSRMPPLVMQSQDKLS